VNEFILLNCNGPLRQQKIIELVGKEELLTVSSDSPFPATPASITNGFQVLTTRVVRIKNEKHDLPRQLIEIYSQ